MSKQNKTAGKTASSIAASAAKLDEIHKARVARWRKHAEEYARLSPEDHKRHTAYVDFVKTAEIVAEAEGLRTVDFIVSHLVKNRIATGKNATPGRKYYDEIDTNYESYSTKTRNVHEKELVEFAFRSISFGLPKAFRFFPRREIKTLISQFYRRGDYCMCPAVMRAIHHATRKEVA